MAWTHVDPTPARRGLSELRLLHPVAMLHAGGLDHLRLVAMLNLEGVTLPDGELAPGAWGEGFVDRRHPHTYFHELLLTGDDLLGGADGAARVSLTAGKGFAPFGTDDPMVRPPLRYPVNHHLAQVLERAVLIAAVRAGGITVEGGVFNGDEPERPGQWPRIGHRFGDSWSGRVTLAPRPGLELQASHASLHSPEHRPGAGPDQRKWSVSARWSGPVGGAPVYGLLEWARTSEADGFFVFRSLLAEGAWRRGRHRLHYRFERTERPEEERIAAFRSRRPHLEDAIVGISRWSIHTAGYELAVWESRAISLRPLVEVSAGRVATVGGGVFSAVDRYGRETFWSLTLGLRCGVGQEIHRMGRYGAAAAMSPRGEHPHHGGR